MANTLLTSSIITKESLAVLHQKLNFVGNINRQYDDRFANEGAKIGDTLQIRLPNEYTVRTGATIDIQDTENRKVDLTMATQKGVDMKFSSKELTLDIEEFKERHIEPAMSVLAASMESDALSMYKQVYNFYDGVGAAATYGGLQNCNKILTDNLAPSSMRNHLHDTQSTVDVLDNTKGLFQDSSQIAKQYREGLLGRIAG